MSRLAPVLAALLVAACTSSGGAGSVKKSDRGWFEARPLIMPGQRAATVHPDSFASLHVPTSESAYSRLSDAQQAALANALHGVDCAHPPVLPNSPDRVVCDAVSDVFLLGAPLFTGDDVARANTIAPSPSVQGWEVSLTLTSTAANKLYLWTSRHHSQIQSGVFNEVQTSSKPPCGLTTLVPCSAFSAFLSDGRVVATQVWFAGSGYSIVVQGDFHSAFANRLARRLNS
jgi:hypothetical protein